VGDSSDCNDGGSWQNPATSWYADADSDGYGDPLVSMVQCAQPSGYLIDNSDCDDSDVSINPQTPWYVDADSDGYGDSATTLVQCTQPSGFVRVSGDCDDADLELNPDTTWFADLDLDGYGDDLNSIVQCTEPSGYLLVAGDCDDLDDAVSPDAIEICDGIDNDCDAGTPETGMVSFEDVTGLMDVSSYFSGGGVGAPVSVVLSDAGELNFCDGDYYVNIEVAADATLRGINNPTLHGEDAAPVVGVYTDGITVRLEGLTLSDGIGAAFSYYTGGGGLLCDALASVEIVDTIISDNRGNASGAGNGGGVAINECSLDMLDSEISYNAASSGGGLFITKGSVLIDGTTIDHNTAATGGGVAISETSTGSTFDMIDSLVTRNSSTGQGGGIYVLGFGAYADLTCTGTVAGDAGVTGNTAGSNGGGVYAYATQFTLDSDTCDWGSGPTSDNNSPSDIYMSNYLTGSIGYSSFVANQTFFCTAATPSCI
jgi:hypothetical protein